MPWYTGHGKEFELVNVTKMPFKKARKKLNSKGLYVEVIDSAIIQNTPPGLVWKQIPEPGSQIKEGRAVQLVVTKSRKKIKMPRLIGKSFKAAKMDLERAGIETDINLLVSRVYSNEKPEGVVINQSIKEGLLIRPSQPIHMVISKGSPEKIYKVPDLIGRSLKDAENQLRKSGLKIGEITYTESSDFTPRTVVKQSIPPKTIKYEPISVNLTVTR
ncbi:MAG: PASTA domain-containing protein [Candidatus Marinimicrobia bacterium]|nr:PASTA domain-containing protein [Candidatus Neomarinimicrobiota bacterium]